MSGLTETLNASSLGGLAAAVFAVSVLGSGHCALMCGGFVLALVEKARHHAAYQGGRLLGYLLLGAGLGWAGAGVAAAELLPLALLAAGGLALLLLQRSSRGRAWFAQIHRRVLLGPLPGTWRAFFAGLMTALLPCGWLYAALAAGLAAQSAPRGAVVLGFFWLGSVPALVLAPQLLRRWLRPTARRFSSWLAVAVIAFCLLSLGARLGMSLAPTSQEGRPPACPMHPSH